MPLTPRPRFFPVRSPVGSQALCGVLLVISPFSCPGVPEFFPPTLPDLSSFVYFARLLSSPFPDPMFDACRVSRFSPGPLCPAFPRCLFAGISCPAVFPSSPLPVLLSHDVPPGLPLGRCSLISGVPSPILAVSCRVSRPCAYVPFPPASDGALCLQVPSLWSVVSPRSRPPGFPRSAYPCSKVIVFLLLFPASFRRFLASWSRSLLPEALCALMCGRFLLPGGLPYGSRVSPGMSLASFWPVPVCASQVPHVFVCSPVSPLSCCRSSKCFALSCPRASWVMISFRPGVVCHAESPCGFVLQGRPVVHVFSAVFPRAVFAHGPLTFPGSLFDPGPAGGWCARQSPLWSWPVSCRRCVLVLLSPCFCPGCLCPCAPQRYPGVPLHRFDPFAAPRPSGRLCAHAVPECPCPAFAHQ